MRRKTSYTPEQIAADADLCQRTSAGDPEAAEQFYNKYYRLARYFGAVAAQECHNGIVDRDDLSQEAILYMFHRAGSFSAEREIAFSSYVSSYILHHLRRTVDTQYSTQLPSHIHDIIHRMEKLNTLRLNNGHTIMTNDEIAEEFDIASGGPFNARRISAGAIQQARLLTKHMGSLDSGFSPQAEHSPGNEYIIDRSAKFTHLTGQTPESVEEQVAFNELREHIDVLLSELNERESGIVRMRFGFNDDPTPATLEQIGDVYGISKERVRQIISRTTVRMLHKARQQGLDQYFDIF